MEKTPAVAQAEVAVPDVNGPGAVVADRKSVV